MKLRKTRLWHQTFSFGPTPQQQQQNFFYRIHRTPFSIEFCDLSSTACFENLFYRRICCVVTFILVLWLNVHFMLIVGWLYAICANQNGAQTAQIVTNTHKIICLPIERVWSDCWIIWIRIWITPWRSRCQILLQFQSSLIVSTDIGLHAEDQMESKQNKIQLIQSYSEAIFVCWNKKTQWEKIENLLAFYRTRFNKFFIRYTVVTKLSIFSLLKFGFFFVCAILSVFCVRISYCMTGRAPVWSVRSQILQATD